MSGGVLLRTSHAGVHRGGFERRRDKAGSTNIFALILFFCIMHNATPSGAEAGHKARTPLSLGHQTGEQYSLPPSPRERHVRRSAAWPTYILLLWRRPYYRNEIIPRHLPALSRLRSKTPCAQKKANKHASCCSIPDKHNRRAERKRGRGKI